MNSGADPLDPLFLPENQIFVQHEEAGRGPAADEGVRPTMSPFGYRIHLEIQCGRRMHAVARPRLRCATGRILKRLTQSLAEAFRVWPRAVALVGGVIHREKHLEGITKGETKMKTLKTMILSVSRGCTVGSQRALRPSQGDCRHPVRIHRGEHHAAGRRTTPCPATSTSHDLMLIRNVEARKAILVLAPSSERAYRSATPQRTSSSSTRIGDRYFLAEVETDAVCGATLRPSKLERETRLGGRRPDQWPP
jgi:hypothetical protein